MSKLVPLAKAKSYIQRETFLDTMNLLIPNMNPEYCTKQIVPLVSTLCSDPIVNVRITVCQVVKTMYIRDMGEK